MAKVFKKNNTLYDVSAKVCVLGSDGMRIAEFSGVGFSSKSEIKIKKAIRDTYKEDGYKVLGISDIVVNELKTTTVYKFDISTDELISLLMANEVSCEVVTE